MFSEKLLELAKVRKFNKPVANSTHKIEKSNPLCGDRVCFDLEIKGNILINVSSNYESCALVHASLNYVLEFCLNKDLNDIEKLINEFEAYFIENKESEFIMSETELQIFNEIKSSYPSRKNCIILPFYALRELF